MEGWEWWEVLRWGPWALDDLERVEHLHTEADRIHEASILPLTDGGVKNLHRASAMLQQRVTGGLAAALTADPHAMAAAFLADLRRIAEQPGPKNVRRN